MNIRKMANTLFATENRSEALLLRMALGLVMLAHGAQKLTGWFGGYGFENTMDYFTESMGISWLLGFAVIMIESIGSIFLILGFLTRPVAAGLLIIMLSAAWMVHWQHGFFMNWFGNQQGEGIEFFILGTGMALALMRSGGGIFSMDSWLGSAIGLSREAH
ncbi:MAG: DoxX family protein [Leptospiraceae bacterium]